MRADLRQALADDARRRAADGHADPERALATGIRALRRRIALGYGAAVLLVVAALTLDGARSDAEPPGSLVTPGPTMTPVALVVDPPEVALVPGESLPLTARATLDDGTAVPVVDEVGWTSSDPGVVDVVTGVVTGRRAGTATVTASWRGLQGSAQVVVQDGPAQQREETLAVVPAQVSLSEGDEGQAVAVVTGPDGTETDVSTDAAWSSDPDEVVQVDGTGRLLAVAVGTATITATWQTHEATTVVTVTRRPPEPVSMRVSPGRADVPRRDTVRLGAIVEYEDGALLEVQDEVEWTSSAPEVATVDGGLVTAVGSGSATITARWGDLSASALISVPFEVE